MSTIRWTADEVSAAIVALRKSRTVKEACERLSAALGRPVDDSNLRAVLKARGLGKASHYLDSSPIIDPRTVRTPQTQADLDQQHFNEVRAPAKDVTPTPLERRAAETAAARIKREHGQLMDQLEEANRRELLREALAAAPLPPIKRRELGSGLREGTFVALMSDMHVEEMVLPSASTFDNAYALEIADLRMGRFFTGVEWLIQSKRPSFQLRDVLLWLGGDLMTGHLHDENVETGQLSQVETILWLIPRIVSGIRQLLADPLTECLTVVCSYGNHGRNTRKPMRARGAAHSYEWFMYQQLAVIFADEIRTGRMRWLADPSSHQYVEVYGLTAHFHHGDETSYQGGVGGIMIALNKAIAQWNKVRRADLNNFGHYHQLIQTGDCTGNGCGIGYNNYGMSIKASPEPAQQATYIVDSKRGKCEMTQLWLEDRSSENALRIARGWAPWRAV